uniref:7TM GPCR serpentine receptor class x (Srx) domain-containing protein n=1 Tax=Romanomermis culicivorax TaxID=13658 RepID=A0A915JYR3_ROMCU
MDSKGQWCFITGFLVLMCTVGGVISQPLLSINRYFAMFHPEKSKKFLKKPFCICIVMGIYVLSFFSAYSFVPFDEYGRFEEMDINFDEFFEDERNLLGNFWWLSQKCLQHKSCWYIRPVKLCNVHANAAL